MTLQYQNSFYTYNTLVDFDLVSSKSFIKSINTNLIKYYTIFINTLILVYGVYLGCTTLLPWNVLVSEWTIFLFVSKTIFFLIFIFDFVFVLKNSLLLKSYSLFKTLIDFLFLLVDLTIIIHLIIFLIFRDDISNLGPGSNFYKLNISLRFLFCISVFRLHKICFLFKPLFNLSQGIFLTMRSLVWTGVFVFLVIYSCSIMTTWMLNDEDDYEMVNFWGSLIKSMYTLFTVLTLEGWNEVSNRTAVFYPNAKLFFVLYVSFTTLTVMNVVTGIILDTFISASEKLYAENFYKGTYKKQFNVSRLVNIALKKMKYSPLSVKEYSKDDSDLSVESINDYRTQGSLKTYKKYFKNLFGKKRKKDKEYKEKLKKFNDIQGKASFEKKEFSSFETKVSEEPETNTSRNNNIDNEKYGIKKSNSNIENIDKQVEFITINNSHSSPNLNDINVDEIKFNELNFDELEGLEDEVDLDLEAKEKKESDNIGNIMKRSSDFVDHFKKYSNMEIEDGLSNGNTIDSNSRDRDSSRSRNKSIFRDINRNYNKQEIIDLEENDPSTIINDEVMEEALKAANISKYHAYDVLNMYYVNGFRKIKVQEFAISCSRISGSATNRELLSFELVFRRRLDSLEDSISRINEKMDRIINSINKM